MLAKILAFGAAIGVMTFLVLFIAGQVFGLTTELLLIPLMLLVSLIAGFVFGSRFV